MPEGKGAGGVAMVLAAALAAYAALAPTGAGAGDLVGHGAMVNAVRVSPDRKSVV